jgi:hypothetical protein
VATLAGKLAESERRRAKRQTGKLEAYDCVLRGRSSGPPPEDNREARRLYEKAIELDPDYARLRQPPGHIWWSTASDGWPRTSRLRALEIARRGDGEPGVPLNHSRSASCLSKPA